MKLPKRKPGAEPKPTRSSQYGATPAQRAAICHSAARMIERGYVRALNSAVLAVAPVHGRAMMELVKARAKAAGVRYGPGPDGVDHHDTAEGRAARVAVLEALAADYADQARNNLDPVSSREGARTGARRRDDNGSEPAPVRNNPPRGPR